jgi:ribose transport system permease protein
MNIRITFQKILRYPWIWAVLGTLAMWILLGVFSGRFNFDSLITISVSACFLAVMAFGQMLVVTTGNGAIDLSIAGMITFSAFLSAGWVNGNNINLIWVIPITLAIGALVGFFNSLSVLFLKIPPMIATMGMNYIIITFVMIVNKNFRAFKIAPLLLGLTRFRLFGIIPVLLLFVILMIIVCNMVLHKTRFGKSLLALGQNLEAANMAGINTNLMQMFAYCLSGLLAALGGILISARAGGAFLGLGDPYQLQTVASVVVGGTLISGGRAVPTGTFFGCMFLILLTTAMQVAGMKIGGQYIVMGLLIIAVLFLASKNEKQ